MFTLLDTIFLFILLLSIVYFLTLLITSFYHLRMSRPPNCSDTPAVSILKPLKGLDHHLEDNLRSFFLLDYPKYELIFGVSDEKDPAVAVVQNLQQEFPQISSRLIIDSTETGLNPKINNLQNMSFYARFSYFLISDSNIRVTPGYLKDLMAHMQISGTGLVTSTIRGRIGSRVGSVLESLHLNAFIAPNVFAINNLIKLPISIGKSMLFRKEEFNRLGGFRAYRNLLAEDHLIGTGMKSLGLKVRTSPLPIDNINGNWNITNFMSRHLRWAKLRKNLNEFYYMAELLSNPIPLAMIYAFIRWELIAFQMMLAVILIKMLIDIIIIRLLKSDIRWFQYLFIPIKDLLIGFIWFVPHFSRKVSWRGNTFKISRNTQLIPIMKG